MVAVLVPDTAPTALTAMVLPAWLALNVYSKVKGTICLGSERLGYFSDLLDVGDDGIIVVHGDGFVRLEYCLQGTSR